MASNRALPTPRAEGMSNIIAATIRLLEVKGPHEVTLRDVAKESGHGHRLISEWFGGKGGLYAAVVTKTFENLVNTGELFYSDIAVRPEGARGGTGVQLHADAPPGFRRGCSDHLPPGRVPEPPDGTTRAVGGRG